MLRILLLEDDEFDAMLVKREIDACGLEFELTLAQTEAEFVSLLQEPRDLILSDCSLPGLARGEGLEIAKQHSPDVPVILLSGALPEEAVADFLKAGATDFVNKDRLERLPLAIRRAMEETERRTALATAQRELIEAKEAAEQANAAKDRFIATLSHELRTPLTPVMLSLELIQYSEDVPPSIASSLETMRRNLELEVQLINDLLDLTAISKGKFQLKCKTVEFGDLVKSAVEVCRADASEKEVVIQVILPETALVVDADPRRTQQAIWNLLRNAIKFTPGGGQVKVELRPAGDRLRLLVTDTGIGIAQEHLEQIFSPFDQGRTGRRGGLGLGLAIAREIVEAQGGMLVAASDGEGLGSTFTITMPLAGESMPEVQEEVEPHATRSPRRGLRIALVEDNVDTASLVGRLLRREGFHVDVAGSCAEARELLSGGTHDLLVSDIGLPDGNGYELRRGIAFGKLKSIALTGYGQEGDVQRAMDAGFDRQLTKPVEFEALLQAIDTLVAPIPPVEAASENGRSVE